MMPSVTPTQYDYLLAKFPAATPAERAGIADKLDRAVAQLTWIDNSADPTLQIHADEVRIGTLLGSTLFELETDYSVGRHARRYRLRRSTVLTWAKVGIVDVLSARPNVDVVTGKRGLLAQYRGPRVVGDADRPPVPRDSPAWRLLCAVKRRPCPVLFEELAARATADATALAAAHALTRMGIRKEKEEGHFTYCPFYTIWSSGRLGEVLGGLQGASGAIKRAVLGGRTYDLKNCQPRVAVALGEALGVDGAGLLRTINSLDTLCLQLGIPRAIGKQALIAVIIGGERALARDGRSWRDRDGREQRRVSKLEKGIGKHNRRESSSIDVTTILPLLREAFKSAAAFQQQVANAILKDAQCLQLYVDWRRLSEIAPAPIRTCGWSKLRQCVPGLYQLKVHDNGIHLRNAAGASIPLLRIDGKRAHHAGRIVSSSRLLAHLLQGAEVAIVADFEAVSAKYGFSMVHLDHDGWQCIGEVPYEAVEEVRRNLGWAMAPGCVELVEVLPDGTKLPVAPALRTGDSKVLSHAVAPVTEKAEPRPDGPVIPSEDSAPTRRSLQPVGGIPVPRHAPPGGLGQHAPAGITSKDEEPSRTTGHGQGLVGPPSIISAPKMERARRPPSNDDDDEHNARPILTMGEFTEKQRRQKIDLARAEAVRLTGWYQMCLTAFVGSRGELGFRKNHLLEKGDTIDPARLDEAAAHLGASNEEYLALLAAANVGLILDRTGQPTWARQAHSSRASDMIAAMREAWRREPDGGEYSMTRHKMIIQRISTNSQREKENAVINVTA